MPCVLSLIKNLSESFLSQFCDGIIFSTKWCIMYRLQCNQRRGQGKGQGQGASFQGSSPIIGSVSNQVRNLACKDRCDTCKRKDEILRCVGFWSALIIWRTHGWEANVILVLWPSKNVFGTHQSWFKVDQSQKKTAMVIYCLKLTVTRRTGTRRWSPLFLEAECKPATSDVRWIETKQLDLKCSCHCSEFEPNGTDKLHRSWLTSYRAILKLSRQKSRLC